LICYGLLNKLRNDVVVIEDDTEERFFSFFIDFLNERVLREDYRENCMIIHLMTKWECDSCIIEIATQQKLWMVKEDRIIRRNTQYKVNLYCILSNIGNVEFDDTESDSDFVKFLDYIHCPLRFPEYDDLFVMYKISLHYKCKPLCKRIKQSKLYDPSQLAEIKDNYGENKVYLEKNFRFLINTPYVTYLPISLLTELFVANSGSLTIDDIGLNPELQLAFSFANSVINKTDPENNIPVLKSPKVSKLWNVFKNSISSLFSYVFP